MTGKNWGLLGHEWAVDLLRNQVKKGNIEHSYLLAGAPGIGRTTLALRFTQVLNCQNPPEPGEACLECRNCIQIANKQFSDLLIVESDYEGAALKIENIREAMHWLTLAPYQGNYRVAIFRRFHEAYGSQGAAENAMLKTIEEPSSRAIIFLLADSPEQLLPTTTSRCEVLRLRAPSVSDLQKYLLRQGSSQEEAEFLAHISAGRPGYALSLRNSPDFLKQRENWLNDLASLLPAGRVKRFAYAEKLSKVRISKKKNDEEEKDQDNEASLELTNIPRQALETWGSFWRDVMITASGSQVPLVNIDRIAIIQGLAKQLGFSKAKQVVLDIEKSIERMDRFVNVRLLLEVLLLKIPFVPNFEK
ncbi:MAG: ATP-binding protein [Anaerolineales bacterium]